VSVGIAGCCSTWFLKSKRSMSMLFILIGDCGILNSVYWSGSIRKVLASSKKVSSIFNRLKSTFAALLNSVILEYKGMSSLSCKSLSTRLLVLSLANGKALDYYPALRLAFRLYCRPCRLKMRAVTASLNAISLAPDLLA